MRFTFYVDPTITDQEEKEAASRGIVAAGEAALPAIREYCKKAESLTWPLKTLKQIVGEDAWQRLAAAENPQARRHRPPGG